MVRQSIGGGVRQAGVIAAAARVAVEETFGHGASAEAARLQQTHSTARRMADFWTKRGGKLANPVETNMIWLDLVGAGLQKADIVAAGAMEGLKLAGGRIVIHYRELCPHFCMCSLTHQRCRKKLLLVLKGFLVHSSAEVRPMTLKRDLVLSSDI
jgi:threonine aldolase